MVSLIFIGISLSSLAWYWNFLVVSKIVLIWWLIRSHIPINKSQRIETPESISGVKWDFKHFGNFPPWVLYPDKERADWINDIISQLWPNMNDCFVKLLRGSIQTNIRKQYEAFKFEYIDFGNKPPKIDGIKVYNNCKRIRNSIVIDLDLFYDSNCDIKFSISGAHMGGIRDFQLYVVIRIVLKPILSRIPLIGAIQIFFLNTPDIDFTLGGISSFPGLNYLIRQQIEKKITKRIVFPNKYTIKLSDKVDMTEMKSIKPEGVLRVHVFEAKDLEKKDITGKSDPYVVLYMGAQEYQTPCVKRSLNPKWDYWCEFVVLDPMCQQIGFKLYDEDEFNEDDFLGSGEVDIKSIVKANETDQWIKLDRAKKGSIHLRFTWLSLSSDYNSLAAALEEIKQLKITNLSTAVLMVFVDSAQNLPSVNAFKKPDPYMKVSVRSTSHKTKSRKYTINPMWEQGFVFLISDPETAKLNMTIVDKRTSTVLEQFTYTIKNLSVVANMELSKFEFQLATENCKIVLSLQLRILTNDDFVSYSDTDSDDFDGPILLKNLDVEEMVEKSHSTPAQQSVSNSPSPDECKLGRIELTLTYSELRQKLIVTLHKLSHFSFNEQKDLPDSYIKLQLCNSTNQSKCKSKVKENSCNPVFEERFEYLISTAELDEEKLIVTVKTIKKLSFNNNVVGRVVIPLKGINSKESNRAWYDLIPDVQT